VPEQEQQRIPGRALTPAQAFDTAVALHQQGKLAEAERIYRAVVQAVPDHFGATHNLGVLASQHGAPQEAERLLRRALTLKPDSADAHNNLGTALRAMERDEDAIASFRAALAVRADFAEAHNNLGVALARLERHEEALAAYERALALRPAYFEARNNLANALAALGRHVAAVAQFEQALALAPGAPGTHNNLGNALMAMSRHGEAERHFRAAIAAKPDFFEAHNNLGNALAASGRPVDALAHFLRAIELNPRYAEAHSNLGNAFAGLNRYDEAMECLRRALAIEPELSEAHFARGNVLVTLGRVAEGRQAFERAIALSPRRPEFYRSLAECKRFAAGDPHLAAMEAMARDTTALPDDERIALHFALAKAYDDISRPDEAFQHLRQANALKRARIDYDERAALDLQERVAAIFSAEFMRGKSGSGDPSAVPVFVIGMPRSGTTLVEQIIASHPEAFGAGELSSFREAVNDALHPPHLDRWPEAVAAMTPQQLRDLGADYVRRVAALSPAKRIVDKGLENFLFAGLIHLALPQARIIHVRRDAADTCFSCYSKLFTGELPFTYDLGELGRYYRGYAQLMTHWRRVLPRDAMLEVQYEEMVADLPEQARSILAYCGLPWDERCLAFHETQRPVRTTSAAQVRRPIYQTSVGRWRPYAPMLQPLLAELER